MRLRVTSFCVIALAGIVTIRPAVPAVADDIGGGGRGHAPGWELRVPSGDSCACPPVSCWDRQRPGCSITCTEPQEPECDCEARCTVMGRLVAHNSCECHRSN